jgi:nicotinamidase-related amidase
MSFVTTKLQPLPVPDFYNPKHAASWAYQPNAPALLDHATQWRRQYTVKPAGSDRRKLHLLLIDVQKDFCLPQGTLYVGGRSGTGAIDDSDRIATFIYRNLQYITEITCTMDTHFPYQIFFPAFWLDTNDQAPPAHSEVTTDQIRTGKLRPNPAIAWWLCSGNYPWLQRQVEFYCAELERAGKYTLYLWPPHCVLGADGHALVGVLQEARLFHAFLRGARAWVEVKGGNALTENYSVLAPEVLMRHDGRPLAQRHTQFVKTLLDADAVIIAGQAASHCVKSSIEDLLGEIRSTDEKLAQKVYILRDCMSAVAVPDPTRAGQFLFDFTPQAETALQKFVDAGMHVVTSTEPIPAWPGMNL